MWLNEVNGRGGGIQNAKYSQKACAVAVQCLRGARAVLLLHRYSWCAVPAQRMRSACAVRKHKKKKAVLAQCNLMRSPEPSAWMIFFRAFGKWAMQPKFLFETEGEAAAALKDIKSVCARAGVRQQNWSPETLQTQMNALAAFTVYLVPSAPFTPE